MMRKKGEERDDKAEMKGAGEPKSFTKLSFI